MPIRIHDGDDDCAFLQARKLGGLGAAHLEHDICAVHRADGDVRAGGGIIRIEDAGLDAGTRLDGDFGTKADEFFDGFRRRGYARLIRIGFCCDGNLHNPSDADGDYRQRPMRKMI